MVINIKKIIKPSIFCLAFFVIDRFFKILSLHGKMFFYKNHGLSFSIPIPDQLFLYFYIFSFLILLIIVWQFVKILKNDYRQPMYEFQITGQELLMGGIISNLIDRLKFGFVIDYLNFYFFYNNLADLMLIAGALLLLYKHLKKPS